jgi:hypothetical protein
VNQVGKDSQLLETARDFFHFVTQFFEPISASATHIYHSALELCPTSSIVRKLYYSRYNRINSMPRVLVGTPDLWDQTISISEGFDYEDCAWSPCGRSIAGWTSNTIDIRNQLTLELLTTLRPTKHYNSLWGRLAYSHDGRSLAYSCCEGIIIWDIQTGGVLKEDDYVFNYHNPPVWSLDGSTIGVVDEASNVHTYEVVSGKKQNLGKLYSGDEGISTLYQMWPHEASFQAVAMVQPKYQREIKIDIFEIGRTLVKFHSFTTEISLSSDSRFSFSPATFHFCIYSSSTLRIFGDQGSNCLLDVERDGEFGSNHFSPDGSLFAASGSIGVRFWKYTSDCYIPWREFQDRLWEDSSLQISPTLSSILGHSSNVLMVCHLHGLPTTPYIPHRTFAELVGSGDRIAVACQPESTITLLDIHSQNPPQLIDTGVEITWLSVMGNVLLAAGSGKVVAWLLTRTGLVCGVLGDRRADHGDSIWTVPCRDFAIWPVGWVAGISSSEDTYIVFDTESGQLLEDTPQPRSKLKALNDELSRERHLHSSNLSRRSSYDSDSEVPLQSILQRGWVGGPGGRYALWVPVEWRVEWEYGTWHHDLTAMDLDYPKTIFIKF